MPFLDRPKVLRKQVGKQEHARLDRTCQRINATRHEAGYSAENLRPERKYMLQAIGLGAEHDNGKRKGSGSILGGQILVHREENVKFPGISNMPQQPAVFDAGPSGLRHGHNLMARQLRGQTLGEALVQKKAHSGWQKCLAHNCAGGFLQEPDGQFS